MNNSTDWLEIKLRTTEQLDSDALEEALFAAGALSVTLTADADEVMLIEPSPGELPLWEHGMVVTGLFDKGFDPNDALPIITACLGTDNLPLIASQTLADRTWELEWTKYFHPIQFGQDLWICPSNQSVPAEKITNTTQIITLDPGLAFGTGTHPTTAMALEYIAGDWLCEKPEKAKNSDEKTKPNNKGKHVIDFGCGSGILGIAAAKMGAEHVVMTDIDAQALTTTIENAKINQVSDKLMTYLPEALPNRQTDFLIANILLEPLLQLKDTFVDLCHSNSTLLLTGLLKEQVPQIIERYQDTFSDFQLTESGDWAMVVAKKQV